MMDTTYKFHNKNPSTLCVDSISFAMWCKPLRVMLVFEEKLIVKATSKYFSIEKIYLWKNLKAIYVWSQSLCYGVLGIDLK